MKKSPYVCESNPVKIVRVKPTPVIWKTGMQVTELTMENSGSPFSAWVRVALKNKPTYVVPVGRIASGSSEVTVPVTDTHELLNPGETISLRLELFDEESCSGSAKAVYETDKWERSRHWEFYLSQEMHTDLGYTAYPEDLKETYAKYLDTVKKYMKNSDERAEDLQKYKYAIESSYMMGEAYMKKRNADEIQEITDRIRAGRMAVGAGQFNFTLENMSTEGTARAVYYTNRFLVDKLGIQPGITQRMFDNPAFSKSYVDAAVQAGILYGIHSMNPDRSPYHKKKLYDLFYMEGMDPAHKLLVFNGKSYSDNYGFGGSHWDARGSVQDAEKNLRHVVDVLESHTGRNRYPYDKFPLPLVPHADNREPMEEQIIIANQLNKKWEDAGYAYPKITVAFPEQFFEDVVAEYGDLIPTESGTEENWWNDGWATTAFESGISKTAGNLIPVAETAASFASMYTGGKYPYAKIYEAVERNLIYNEHTWGYHEYNKSNPEYDRQFEWKRSHAFSAKALAEDILKDSLKSLASDVATEGKAIYVYNSLNWTRNDVVTLSDLSDLPPRFEIRDGNTSIPYRIQDGVLTFVATGIPAMGYKTFRVVETATAPDFKQKARTGSNFLENNMFRVTFAEDGTVSSILDKRNGNREMVQNTPSARFNQYQYYDDFGIPFSNMGADFGPDKWKRHSPGKESGHLEVTASAIGAAARLKTSTFRAGSIVQTVTLYNDIPRIDIVNEVEKESLPDLKSKEEAFYTFPFQTGKDYEIRYDLPVGNAAEGEQIYGTSTDWYTANKWVSVKDKKDHYNMVLAIPNTSLLQFGERRTGKWSFDYKSSRPTLYSYVMNNMWQTNFQGDQPGYTRFCYSISANVDPGAGESARFGWEISTPLQATVIAGAQTGKSADSGSLILIDKRNIQVSTIKASEANSDGMILRFVEIEGKPAENVSVSFPFHVSSVTETDIIENDKRLVSTDRTFSFGLPAYGMKTFRIRYGEAPGMVEGVQAVSTAADLPGRIGDRSPSSPEESDIPDSPDRGKIHGTEITWKAADGALYYEVFRSTDPNFVPGSGNYLSTTNDTAYFDAQVTGSMKQPYSYRVRAAAAGAKGAPSTAIRQTVGEITDTVPLSAPILGAQPRESTRIDLYWTPSADNILLHHYEIYRNGEKIAQTENSYLTSYRDRDAKPDATYRYMVKAVDARGNASESNQVCVSTGIFIHS